MKRKPDVPALSKDDDFFHFMEMFNDRHFDRLLSENIQVAQPTTCYLLWSHLFLYIASMSIIRSKNSLSLLKHVAVCKLIIYISI